jgi:hypothetical protein
MAPKLEAGADSSANPLAQNGRKRRGRHGRDRLVPLLFRQLTDDLVYFTRGTDLDRDSSTAWAAAS